MKKIKKKQILSIVYIFQLVLAILVVANPMMIKAAQPIVNLNTASSFGILAGSAITNTGPTIINGTAGGDIGLHPGDDPSLETFPGETDVTYSGTLHLHDSVAQQAKVDLVAAYTDAQSRPSDATISADLGGTTLTPGVYTSASSIGLTGTLTLDGGNDPNAVFIFQAGSTLTTAANSRVVLINGAQTCNVFWQVGSSATLGTDSEFIGTILALTSITATTDATILGQLLAINGAVTMDSNTITNNACTLLGSLKVTKSVEGPVDEMTLPDFEITVTGPNNYSDTQIIETDNSYTWNNLASGTYTISENVLGEAWSVEGTGVYVVENNTTTELTLVNTYTPPTSDVYGSLQVFKVVVGDVSDITLPNFEIMIQGPNNYSDRKVIANGESYTWEDLTPGAYTISENSDLLNSEWKISGEATVMVEEDETAVVTITNEYTKTAEIILIPNTGDQTGWLIYGGLGFLVIGMFLMFKSKKTPLQKVKVTKK